MRVQVHEYARGGNTIFETSDDGGDFLGDWNGQRQVGERICGFIEASCDNTEQGVRRLLDSMALLIEEIRKRKLPAECVGVSANDDGHHP